MLLNDASNVQGISIATNDNQCIKGGQYYIKPIEQLEGGLSAVAVCSKMAYYSVNPEILLEWIEVQRMLGVKKITFLTYKLNKKAMDVLRYYESTGLVAILGEFDYPAKDQFRRGVGMSNMMTWNDEQLIINDCYARLYGYKYIAVIDSDEFIIPRDIRMFNFSLKSFFDYVFKDDIAGITMPSIQHITTWEPTRNDSKLFIRRFSNSTAPINDRLKYVHMPLRVKSGLVNVHGLVPEIGFKTKHLPASVVSIHHYRTCRKDGYWIGNRGSNEHRKPDNIYNYKHSNPCDDFIRYNNLSIDMEHIITVIQERVVKLKDELGLHR